MLYCIFIMLKASAILLIFVSRLATTLAALSISINVPPIANNAASLGVEVTVTNIGTTPVSINPAGTILSDSLVDVFNFTGPNLSIPPRFLGISPKYVNNASWLIQQNVLVNLAAGASKSVKILPSDRYNFVDSGIGDYIVALRYPFQVLSPDGKSFVPIDTTVSPVSAKFNLASTDATISKRSSKRRIEPSECPKENGDIIYQAAMLAGVVGDLSLDYLAAHKTDPLYQTWFGAPDPDRLQAVITRYTDMKAVIQNHLYDCSCNLTYAYSYTSVVDPYTVYICPLFFAQSTSYCGPDSRFGTIVHSISRTMDGQDFASGQAAARQLASQRPSQAVMNADSLEYFEESIPLPAGTCGISV